MSTCLPTVSTTEKRSRHSSPYPVLLRSFLDGLSAIGGLVTVGTALNLMKMGLMKDAYSDKEYLGLMDRFRENDMPLSVAVIDIDWHLMNVPEEYGTAWTGYT
jgi:hypothetical protein